MKSSLFPTLKNYKKEYLPKDIFSGIIMAAVSIPISMGYAQIAGLPAVYGLYGSVFPILFFALFSTSRQFIFGVDAAPAAIVGAALVSLGIESGSEAAMQYVPVIAFLTGIWLLLFYFLKAGRIVDFISTPVMGGFISGIALTIILMQIPKILGGKAGSGELPELSGISQRRAKKSAGCQWYLVWELAAASRGRKSNSQIPGSNCDHGSRCSSNDVLSCRRTWCGTFGCGGKRTSEAGTFPFCGN